MRAAGGMGDKDAEPEGAVEIFGVLRLPLASGTASGYVGVRHVKKVEEVFIEPRGLHPRGSLSCFRRVPPSKK